MATVVRVTRWLATVAAALSRLSGPNHARESFGPVIVILIRTPILMDPRASTTRMGREAMTLGGDSSRKLRSLARQSESDK